MDGYYGPGVSNAKTEATLAYPSRPIEIGIRRRVRLGDAPAAGCAGDYVIDAAGYLAALTNVKNYTPEAKAKRKIDYPKVWKIEDHLEKSEVFLSTTRMTDFGSIMSDNRGLLASEWLADDALAPEIAAMQRKTMELDVYVVGLDDSTALSDSRIEVAEEVVIPPEMLMKRFWVFLQNNVQRTENLTIPDFILVVHTNDPRVPGTKTFEATSKYIAGNYNGFLDQVTKLTAEPAPGKFIWWAKADPLLSENPSSKKYQLIPSLALTETDLLRRISVRITGDVAVTGFLTQEIWVGSTGDVSAYPLKNTTPVQKFPSTHWWAAIIDSYAGEAYIHDSLGSTNPKAAELVANINWLLAAQPPEEKKFIQETRFSGLALASNIVMKPLATPCPKQKNLYDCGIFALGNMEAFISFLANDQGTATHKRALLPKVWDARKRRNDLCGKNKPPLQVLAGDIRRNKVAAVDARFNEHPQAYLDEAFWHLDNAGAILLSFKEINPFFRLEGAKGLEDGNPPCKCAEKENSCQFSVLPVPQGYKVVLQSATRFTPDEKGINYGTYQEDMKDLHGPAKEKYLKLAPIGTAKDLCSRYSTALGRHPKVLVANTKGGAFLRSNSHRFQDKRAGGMTDSGILIEGCSYAMTRFGQDCIGPIPEFTYIRIMERTWVWISTEGRPAEDIPAEVKLNDAAADPDPDPDPGPDLDPVTEGFQDGAGVGVPPVVQHPPQTISERTGIQYQGVPLGAARLAKRRRELRGLDLLNKRADSSDDSIDDDMVKYVPPGGIKPRKRKNKRNQYHKLVYGQNKRIYVLSDSERDSDGHDPTGGARPRKRTRLSNSQKNFDLYASRGLVPGFQTRALVRPVNALLGTPMTQKQMTDYRITYNEDRKLRNAVVYVLRLDNQRVILENRILRGGYQRIVRHLKSNKTMAEGNTLSYTTTNQPGFRDFDGEDAYLEFRMVLKHLPKAKRKGTIIVVLESEIPDHNLTLVIKDAKYPVPRKVWLKGDEAIKKYFCTLGILDDSASLTYDIADAGDGKNPPENTIKSLLVASKVPRNVTVNTQILIEVSPICVVWSMREIPLPGYEVLERKNKIMNLSEFADYEDFLEAGAKGCSWEYNYCAIFPSGSALYFLSKPNTRPDELKTFDQDVFNSLKSMKLEPGHRLSILYYMPYDQTRRSALEDHEGCKPFHIRIFMVKNSGVMVNTDSYSTFFVDFNLTRRRILHFCGCSEKGPFWYNLGSGTKDADKIEWSIADSLDTIFAELEQYEKLDKPSLWICANEEPQPGEKDGDKSPKPGPKAEQPATKDLGPVAA